MKNSNHSDALIHASEELPYERFVKYGAGTLTNAELIAIILRTGNQNENALALARHILNFRFQDSPVLEGTKESPSSSLSILYELSLEDLKSIKGIGEVKAVRLLCVAELSRRLSEEKRRDALQFTSPRSIAEYYMERLRHEPQEHVLLVMLDNHLQLLGEKILSVGSSTGAALSPRDVFRMALRYHAVHIILLHNHPSGDPSPSREDLAITRRIAKAGEELEITLLDHIIIGDNRWLSLKETGRLDE